MPVRRTRIASSNLARANLVRVLHAEEVGAVLAFLLEVRGFVAARSKFALLLALLARVVAVRPSFAGGELLVVAALAEACQSKAKSIAVTEKPSLAIVVLVRSIGFLKMDPNFIVIERLALRVFFAQWEAFSEFQQLSILAVFSNGTFVVAEAVVFAAGAPDGTRNQRASRGTAL